MEGYKQIKVVIVGDPRCGKSCFAESFCAKGRWTEPTPWYGSFSQMPQPTRHLSPSQRIVFWEPPCRREYDRLRPLSYPMSHLFVVCCHARDEGSLRNVETFWGPELRHHHDKVTGNNGTPLVLLALRSDSFPTCALRTVINDAKVMTILCLKRLRFPRPVALIIVQQLCAKTEREEDWNAALEKRFPVLTSAMLKRAANHIGACDFAVGSSKTEIGALETCVLKALNPIHQSTPKGKDSVSQCAIS